MPLDQSRDSLASHVLPVRIYYEDTDAAGIVYYANYLRFAERGRTEWLRALGPDHQALMRDHGVAFAVRSCQIDFLAPARLDDLVEVHTTATGFGAASLEMDQSIRRDDMELVRMSVKLACIDRELHPARMPPPLRKAIAEAGVGETEIKG